MANPKYVWLSHELRNDTPAYGGGSGFTSSPEKEISVGSSCNTVKLTFSNHLGTHVDVPYHFLQSGKKLGDYNIEQWLFHKPWLVRINVKPDEIITISKLKLALSAINDIDFLLIKTGFEQYRDYNTYWQHSPAFSDRIAYYLKEHFPSISAIGFDSISLSGYQHRELGRAAHKAFLSQDIRIFEDLHLSDIADDVCIKQITALPLRFENADGSPCTMIAHVETATNNDE